MRPWGICLIFMLQISSPFFSAAGTFYADGKETSSEYEEIQTHIDEILKGEMKLDFKSMVEALSIGDIKGSVGKLGQYIYENTIYEIVYQQKIIVKIMGIIVAGAVFTNFSMAFSKGYAKDAGFYMTYLLILALLLSVFTMALDMTKNVLQNVLYFASALIPAFCLSMTFSGGTKMGIASYQLLFFMVSIVDWVICKVLLSVIQIDVLISLINELSKENHLSKLTELIETCVLWVLKSVFGLSMGMNAIQSLICPAIDTFGKNILFRIGSSIPGVGDAVGTAAEMMVGSGMIIKNAIGAAGVLIIVAICAMPVVKLAMMTFLYRALAAVVQPVADKRMSACIQKTGQGIGLLLKTVCVIVVTFIMTLAIMAAATNQG